jgi:hypothetical protein
MQNQSELRATGVQRSLPVPGYLRLRTAERCESQGDKSKRHELSIHRHIHLSPYFGMTVRWKTTLHQHKSVEIRREARVSTPVLRPENRHGL